MDRVLTLDEVPFSLLAEVPPPEGTVMFLMIAVQCFPYADSNFVNMRGRWLSYLYLFMELILESGDLQKIASTPNRETHLQIEGFVFKCDHAAHRKAVQTPASFANIRVVGLWGTLVQPSVAPPPLKTTNFALLSSTERKRFHYRDTWMMMTLVSWPWRPLHVPLVIQVSS